MLELGETELNVLVRALIGKMNDNEAQEAFAEYARWIRDRDRKCNLAGKDNVPVAELAPSEDCLENWLKEMTAGRGPDACIDVRFEDAVHWPHGAFGGIGAAQVLVSVDEIAREHPRIARRRREIVAHRHVHRSPGMRVECRVQVDAGRHALPIAIDSHEPALSGQLDQIHEQLNDLVHQGKLRNAVQAEIPFDDLPAAIQRLADRAVVGKLVMVR